MAEIIDCTKCAFYNNGKCDNPNGMACNCANNAVCYYKELKRLEQENARLEEEVRAEKIYSSQIEELEESLNHLKQENERLKEENVKLLFDKGTLVEFCNKLTQIIDEKKESENKLLQTLQEIKVLAEKTGCRAIIDLITKAEEE